MRREIVGALAMVWAGLASGAVQADGVAIQSVHANPGAAQERSAPAVDLRRAVPMALPSVDLPEGAIGQRGVDAQLHIKSDTKPEKPPSLYGDSGNPALAPLKWVGLVVNTLPKNEYETCTGQFIAPRVILTAGHCVKDAEKNTWYDVNQMTFYLQYQNGWGSKVYHAVCAAALSAYSYPSNYSQLSKPQQNSIFATAAQSDFAMILVDADSLTGVMPYQLDWKGNWQQATRVGYPGAVLNGEIVQRAEGAVMFADNTPLMGIFTSGQTMSTPNLLIHWQSNYNLTQGMSGGAWIGGFSTTEATGKNVALSVSSFQINNAYPGALFGPYLTATTFNSLLQYVTGGCKS
jgi:hypothetical protein